MRAPPARVSPDELLPAASPLADSVGAFAPPPSDRIDWRRMLQVLLRYKWAVVLVTMLGTAAGVWATRLVDPQFQVQATLWIDQPNPRQGGRERGPIRTSQLLEPVAWVDLLKSYVVLDHVVREMRLYLQLPSPQDTAVMRSFGLTDGFRPGAYQFTAYDNGTYELQTDDGIELDKGTVGDSVGARLGFLWAPGRDDVTPGRTVAFHLLSPRDASRSLAERLNARMDPEGSFLRVELAGTQPRRITTIVNAVVARYVQVAANLKKDKLTELTRILDEQLQVAQQNLGAAESALQRFRVENITHPTERVGPAGGGAEGRDPVITAFFDQQMERDRVRRDRESLESWLETPAAQRAVGPIEALTSVQAAADLSAALKELSAKQVELRALKYRYTDDYAPVRRMTGDIAAIQDQVIPVMVRALVGELRTREGDLDRRIAGAGSSLRAIPSRALEEARLRRAVTLAENLYTTLQQRYEENRIEEASSIPDVRVLDAAVSPVQPFKNTAPRIILLAFVASLGFATGGVVVLDKIDPRVRYPDQVSRDLGLTILGAVPHIATRGSGFQLSKEESAEVVEAMRGVCMNLVYAHGGSGPLLLTVTSPGAGDGKSFLSANLALTFSDGGHRTLLVDADLRRGVQHRRFQVQRRPGLTDFLRGEAPGKGLVLATSYPSLSFLPCGSRTHSAPELLGSSAMTQLFDNLRPSYDVIVVDSPPLTGGVDPFILSAVTGNLMVVLRTGFSHREIAAAKLEMMNRLPVRLLGAVLNDVPRGGSYQYYSYYLPGYEGVEEAGLGRRPDVV